MNIKKTCLNCDDYIVCVSEGTDPTEICENWSISFGAFQEILDKNKITNPNEIEKLIKTL